MIRFPSLEQFNVTAIMSDRSDGDCRTRSGSESFLSQQTIDSPIHLLSQVHSDRMLRACSKHDGAEADGWFTQDPDRVLGIRIADCVPVYLFDPRHRAGALIHAGRDGTSQGIAAQAIQSLHEAFNSQPNTIHAVIGPSAGPCCYEVSSEMAREFSQRGGEVHGRHLDLWETNRAQLLQAGLTRDHIYVSEHCTICNDQFYSYRANAPTARNLALLHIHEDS